MYAYVISAKHWRFLSALTFAFLATCLTQVPATADDRTVCDLGAGQEGIEGCTRLINAELARGDAADAEELGRLFLRRGSAKAVLEQNEPAIADFTKSIEYNPRLYAPYYQRALTFALDQKFKRAIADFNIAISLSPNTPAIYFDRGYSWMRLDQFKRAIPDFTKVIEAETNFASDAYNGRGYAYALSEDYPNALSDFRQAITLNPTAANFRHSLGEGLFYSGKPEEARTVWKEACQLATPYDIQGWHEPLAKQGYYSGDIGQPCNEQTLKAFEMCAQAKCRF